MRLPPIKYIHLVGGIPFKSEIPAHYSSIIPNSFGYLLFSKLCQHNLSKPNCTTPELLLIYRGTLRLSHMMQYLMHR